MSNIFPYKTAIDRSITNDKGETLFTIENPAYVQMSGSGEPIPPSPEIISLLTAISNDLNATKLELGEIKVKLNESYAQQTVMLDKLNGVPELINVRVVPDA